MSDFTRAIPVVVSTTLNIPEPGAVYKGSSSTNGTTVTSTGFLTSNVTAGDSIQVGSTGEINLSEEIHTIISVDSDTELTLSTGVVIAAPFDFAIYRANGGSTLVGNSGYTLLTQIEPGTEIRVIPVGQTEEVVITDQGGGGGTLDQVLSKIKVQRVTLADNPMIIALDTD
jgi:pSer/pThr/pTyr-binding forkhead associated (FHA) protein